MIRSCADGDLGEVVEAWYRASLEACSFLSDDFFEAEPTDLEH